jgi:hypothetical protein
MPMKKILFIIPYVPYPLISGGNQAFFHMIEYARHEMAISVLLYPKSKAERKNIEKLSQIWTNVEFLVFQEKIEEPKAKNPLYYKLLKNIKESAARKMHRLLIEKTDLIRRKGTLSSSIFHPLPNKYIEYISEISKRGFDIIQVEFYELISLGYILPNNVETIFVHHELRYIHNENEMALLDKVTHEEQMLYDIAKEYERSALLKFRHIIALTDIDRNILSDFIGRSEHIYTSPAIVEVERNLIKKNVIATTRLTFVGSEDHFPNLDAVNWFCTEVAPILREKGFHFTFQVIGHWHNKYIKYIQNICPEMELTGYIENLHSFLQGSIFLVPIRIGSGMRIKILDAVLSRVPFISTAKGIEGIDFHHEKECLIANSPHDFSTAIIHLSQNPKIQENLTEQAATSLQKLYNPKKMLELRMNIYKQILKK